MWDPIIYLFYACLYFAACIMSPYQQFELLWSLLICFNCYFPPPWLLMRIGVFLLPRSLPPFLFHSLSLLAVEIWKCAVPRFPAEVIKLYLYSTNTDTDIHTPRARHPISLLRNYKVFTNYLSVGINIKCLFLVQVFIINY